MEDLDLTAPSAVEQVEPAQVEPARSPDADRIADPVAVARTVRIASALAAGINQTLLRRYGPHF